eukprot:gnl/TRDRNA2_/TRDRNA2_31039_c0_seq1.p2 gnl/TRDRNA2_/TRDRNA2_31039_c0~~gnl/TRDRNA2_/TRDRNA2_31039_c0_seq1.p2  ORF type:complete len:327 (-),score=100.50 gnl/TRDRNA2_/TRDRNA2_31039_c0_seq1:65-1045(-)
MLAGMGSVSAHELVAAVSNSGGFGTFGGVGMTAKMLRQEIKFVKEALEPGKRFGVDLLLPQVGGNARKTNKDYTGGKLNELIDIIIEEKVALFVSAVGVPPKWAVDKLHAAGIPVMNMVGAPHHVPKALEQGVDIICAQGTEAGGHTGVVATMPLIPQCVDLTKGKKNFFGMEVPVVAAGGFFDGRGLAAALALGAQGIWVGTRFICTPEAATSKAHQDNVVNASSIDCMQTVIYTGRPVRVKKSEYAEAWEKDSSKIKELTSKGVVPFEHDIKEEKAKIHMFTSNIMGQAVGGIHDVKPAKEIVDEMVAQALSVLEGQQKLVARL